MDRFRCVALATALGLASAAFAGPVSAAPPSPVTSADAWTGVYVGGEIGGRWSNVNGSVNSATNNGGNILVPGSRSATVGAASSVRGGVYVGYDDQLAPNWVVGVEGDWNWGNNDRTLAHAIFPGNAFYLTGRPDDSFEVKQGWDASLRARVGYLVTPSTLIYAAGGVAWTDIQTRSICGVLSDCLPGVFTHLFAPEIISNSTTQTGWTVGGGVEWNVSPHVLVRGEYRYSDYGSASFTDTRVNSGLAGGVTQVANYSVKLTTSTAMFGVAYKF